MVKIHWLARKPNPYNNYLFGAVSADPEIDLKVHFMQHLNQNHPWKQEIRQDFNSRVFETIAGLDRELLLNTLREPQSFFILGGFWYDPTVIVIAQCLSILGRPFALWTDTPNISKQRQIFKRQMRDLLLSTYFKNAYRIMGTGEVALKSLEQIGCPRHKLVNFPFFVDLEKFKPPVRRVINAPLVFLSSGRLDNAHKGYDLAIEALGLVKQRTGYNFVYRIAGTGKDEKQLRALVKQYDLEDRVEFVGWLEDEELNSFYHSGHVLLHPSHFDPFPVSVLEAMAAGLTVVGSDQAGSVVERIVSGENGLVHRCGDVEDLADKIVFLLQNPTEVIRFGNAARQTSEEWPVSRALHILKKDIIKVSER